MIVVNVAVHVEDVMWHICSPVSIAKLDRTVQHDQYNLNFVTDVSEDLQNNHRYFSSISVSSTTSYTCPNRHRILELVRHRYHFFDL